MTKISNLTTPKLKSLCSLITRSLCVKTVFQDDEIEKKEIADASVFHWFHSQHF